MRDGTRRVQEDILKEVLQHVKPKTPLLLHIRSTKPDRYSKCLYLRALEILKQQCHPTQKVILHCFTGDEFVRAESSNQFPIFFQFLFYAKKI